MRAFGVVVDAPFLDNDLGFLETVEDFAIEAFRPERAALLGEGLWGRVYDLGDGTVLKVAREHCAGIGNGVEKIASEHAGADETEQCRQCLRSHYFRFGT